MEQKELTFEEWRKTVLETIRSEKFWLLIAYQKSLYLYDLLWHDTEVWSKMIEVKYSQNRSLVAQIQSALISKKVLVKDTASNSCNSMATLWDLLERQKGHYHHIHFALLPIC